MNYKNIFKSKKLRFKILSILRFVPDKQMLQLQYRIKTGRKLNLDNPQRYTEKIQWYKLYYRNPLMPRCADKYTVREYVKSKGYEHILTNLYAMYENIDDINFEQLPERFVLKLSNGSSTNILCKNKADFDLAEVKEKFKEFYVQSGSNAGREWVYHCGIQPVILAEQYLVDPDEAEDSLKDYKIFCFNGKPEYIICVAGRYTDDYCHVVYNTKWEKQDVIIGESSANAEYKKPETLDEMLHIAKVLSSEFPAARIDLYSIKGKIYFGEITFFPWSGYMHFMPYSFDFELGKKFILPKENT